MTPAEKEFNEEVRETRRTSNNGKETNKILISLQEKITTALRDVTDKSKQSLDTASRGISEGLTRSFLGPFEGLINESFGVNIAESISGGVGKIFSKGKDLFKGTKTEDSMLGIESNTKLLSSIASEQLDLDKAALKDEKLKMKQLEGSAENEKTTPGGIRGFIDNLTTPGALLRMGGAAAFIGLIADDFIKHGLPKFLAGDWLGGAIDTLLGKKSETDKEVGLNMLKQAGKWGGLGLAIGGPVGLAVGAGIGFLAAGVKGAFDMEWDKQVEGTGDRIKELWNDPSKGVAAKIVGTLGEAGKGVLGVFSGGIRGAIEGAAKAEKLPGKIVNAIGGFIVGVHSTFSEFLTSFIPVDKIRKWGKDKAKPWLQENILSPVDNVMGKVAGKLGFGEAYDRLRNRLQGKQDMNIEGAVEESEMFANSLSNSIRVFFNDVKEEGLVSAIGERVGPAIEKTKEFFHTVGDKMSGMFDNIKESALGSWLSDKIRMWSDSVKGFFVDLGSRIGDFLGIGKGAGTEISSNVDSLINQKVEALFDRKSGEMGGAYSDWLRTMGVRSSSTSEILEELAGILESEGVARMSARSAISSRVAEELKERKETTPPTSNFNYNTYSGAGLPSMGTYGNF